MSALSEWPRFARLAPARMAAARDQNLARFVREELACFSEGYRRHFERAGFDPRSLRGAADLQRVPALAAADLLAAERDPARRESFWLAPGAQSLRAAPGLGRRLALGFGGPRALRALAWSYAPVFTAREPGEPSFAYAPPDVARAAESGARALGELGLDRPGERALSLVRPAARLDYVALFGGALQLGLRCEPWAGSPADPELEELLRRLAPTALVGPPEELVELLGRRDLPGLGALRLLAVVTPGASLAQRAAWTELASARAGREVRIALVAALAATRLMFAERPASAAQPTGFALYPDLCVLEVLDREADRGAPAGALGEVVFSASGGRGLPAFRYRTGWLTRGGLADGGGLPRLASDLERAAR